MLALDRLILEICLVIWARKQGFSWEANLKVRERRGELKEGTAVVRGGKDGPRKVKHELFGWQRSPSRVRTKKPRWDPSWEQLRGAGGCVPVRKESQQALNGKWEPIHQSEKVQGILWRSKKSRKYSLKSKQVHGSERSQKRHKEGRNKWLR